MNRLTHRSGAISLGLITVLFMSACSSSLTGLWTLHDDDGAGSKRVALALLIVRGGARGKGLSCIHNRDLYACLYIGTSLPRCIARASALHFFW